MTLRQLVGKLRRDIGDPGAPLYPARPISRQGQPRITPDDAMRNSAVWAAVRVRADLVSSRDIDCMRTLPDGMTVAVNRPPIMIYPSTDQRIRWREWLYSSQVDLDRYGNAIGIIKQRDALNFPKKIDLVNMADVTVKLAKDGTVTYKIARETWTADDIWHEKQYTVSGLPMGLSPIAYAAMTIAQFKSAQDFAINWFTNNAMPAGILMNKALPLKPDQAQQVKDRFKSTMSGGGDVFVTGSDWDFRPVQAQSNDQAWLSQMNATGTDVARFFGVPGDIIDAPTAAGTSIVYANITQRFVQLHTVHLGPALQRRQEAFSVGLMSAPRFCEFNAESLLAMDPATLSKMYGQQIRDRVRTPTEVREKYNLPPMTDADLVEYVAAFGRGPAEADAAVTEGADDAAAAAPVSGGSQ